MIITTLYGTITQKLTAKPGLQFNPETGRMTQVVRLHTKILVEDTEIDVYVQPGGEDPMLRILDALIIGQRVLMNGQLTHSPHFRKDRPRPVPTMWCGVSDITINPRPAMDLALGKAGS